MHTPPTDLYGDDSDGLVWGGEGGDGDKAAQTVCRPLELPLRACRGLDVLGLMPVAVLPLDANDRGRFLPGSPLESG